MSKPREHLYDEECFRLAVYFLEGSVVAQPRTPTQVASDLESLSVAIQTAVEDWFEANPITKVVKNESV